MIKYILRRTIYKGIDYESQNTLLELGGRYHIISLLCVILCGIVYISTYMPLFIINVCKKVEFSLTTQIAIITFEVISFLGLLAFLKVFRIAILDFLQSVVEKIYFLVCKKEGKALSKKDFKTIYEVNKKLYRFIATQKCRGYCYSVCFWICKILQKGAIEFIAIKKLSFEEDDDGKDFTMHVLYINNGWAFDTYNSRQYPIEKLHKIYKAKIYRTFEFDEISSKSYEYFRQEEEPTLEKWANLNNCSEFWKED